MNKSDPSLCLCFSCSEYSNVKVSAVSLSAPVPLTTSGGTDEILDLKSTGKEIESCIQLNMFSQDTLEKKIVRIPEEKRQEEKLKTT